MTWTTRLGLLIVLASLALGACTPVVRESRPTTLSGTVWRVVSINGRPPVIGSEPTAAFTAAEVEGSAGCNTYGGSYAYDTSSGLLTFGNLAMTKMACDAARNEVETRFTQAIAQVTSASIDPEGRLVLSGPAGEIVLTVDAVAA
jgi:heat shock protein HslJ